MDTDEAFRVVRVAPSGDGLLVASGRAYRDLKVGDVLMGQATGPGDVEQTAEFTIVAIKTYGCAVQSLSRMLTGDLMLQGGGSSIPRAETMLIKSTAAEVSAAQRPGGGTDT